MYKITKTQIQTQTQTQIVSKLQFSNPLSKDVPNIFDISPMCAAYVNGLLIIQGIYCMTYNYIWSEFSIFFRLVDVDRKSSIFSNEFVLPIRLVDRI